VVARRHPAGHQPRRKCPHLGDRQARPIRRRRETHPRPGHPANPRRRANILLVGPSGPERPWSPSRSPSTIGSSRVYAGISLERTGLLSGTRGEQIAC